VQRKNPKNIQSLEFSQTKYTPRTRPAHQAAHSGQLENPDPKKKYVLVPTSNNHPFGITHYKAQGYEIENRIKGGPSIIMGTDVKEGSPLLWMECVLMSCSKQRADEIFQKGPTGNTGQEYFDKLMKQIQKNPAQNERFPGLVEKYDINSPEEDLENGNFR
jgi:hypothetical protein